MNMAKELLGIAPLSKTSSDAPATDADVAGAPVADAPMESLPTDIMWAPVDANMVMTVNGNVLSFRRTKYTDHDAAFGQVLEEGVHEWTVVCPNWTPNNFVGVADRACDDRKYPTATTAWAMHIHGGDLCSGAARQMVGQGFTREDGTRGYLPATGKGAKSAKVQKNAMWTNQRCGAGTPVRVILDMDERTLSFAIGDAMPRLAYTHLPDRVHPYICSGEKDDKSLVEVR